MSQAAGVGHAAKSSVPTIFEEPILPNAGDENVGKTVVVVIAHGDAHSVHFSIEAGLAGYVGKSAIAIVVIQAECGCLPLVARPVHAINKEDGLPAVAVVVEKGAARAERFGKEFASVGAAVVLKLNAR